MLFSPELAAHPRALARRGEVAHSVPTPQIQRLMCTGRVLEDQLVSGDQLLLRVGDEQLPLHLLCN